MSRFQLVILWVMLFITQALDIFTNTPDSDVLTGYLLIITLALLASVKVEKK